MNFDSDRTQNAIRAMKARLLVLGQEAASSAAEWRQWANTVKVPDQKACDIHEWVTVDVDVGLSAAEWRRGIRRAVYSPCHECSVSRLLVACGVPALMSECRFKNFKPANQVDVRQLELLVAFGDRVKSGSSGFAIITSPEYGCGKTHLAVAIMARMQSPGMLFLTNAQFMRAVRLSYAGDKSFDAPERCKGATILVFDDLGISVHGKDELPLLHEVFAVRHVRKLPTVFTTNMDGSELPGYFGPRMASRFDEAATVYRLTGPGMRKQLRKSYLRNQ